MELEEMKAQLSNCEIHFYCDVNALREQERADDNDSADQFPSLDYYIKDGTVYSFDDEKQFTLDDIYDEWYYDDLGLDCELIYYFTILFLEMVCLHRLPGRNVIEEFVENEWPMMMLVKDNDGDIIHEVDNFDTVELDV